MKSALWLIGMLSAILGGFLLAWWLLNALLTVFQTGLIGFMSLLGGGDPREVFAYAEWRAVLFWSGLVLLIGGLWTRLILPPMLVRAFDIKRGWFFRLFRPSEASEFNEQDGLAKLRSRE